ncbi:hypothetical protein JX265_003427 [Neoarthrinium moseri]|uniref:Heterokaryon incompatibility domain-containing protein n=1 Tax=Neoarthrinium moseri TaxID=1658444 RepID=A0A9P9WS66_9PEZI|nr:hypothetical protein JX265_003427 [Neoarthrinium moseri]
MSAPNPPGSQISLQQHLAALQRAASIVPTNQPHSCRHCSALFVEISPESPAPAVGSALYFDIGGFSERSVAEGSKAGCPFFNFTRRGTWPHVRKIPNWKAELEVVLTHPLTRLCPIFEASVVIIDYRRPYNPPVGTISGSDRGLDHRDPRAHMLFTYAIGLAQGTNNPLWLRDYRVWPSSAATDASFSQAHGWLAECCCSSTHKRCQPVPTSFTPSRLLKVPSSTNVSDVEIVETKHLGYLPWCSLSYCWGGPQPLQTTTRNFVSGRRTIALSELPQTIADSVLVAFFLKVPYIWIDSLCIIQDDREDVRKELGQMPEIYKNAVFTLVAGTARSSSDGFLNPRDMSQTWSKPTPPIALHCRGPAAEHADHKDAVLLHDQAKMDMERLVEPIDLRAWTLQERLLSPRVLIYGSRTLSWICHSRSYRDSMMPTPEELGIGELGAGARMLWDLPRRKDPRDVSFLWISIVRQYYQRQITQPNDRLIALAGIAQEFSRLTGWDYAAGLWRQGIRHMAAWYLVGEKIHRNGTSYTIYPKTAIGDRNRRARGRAPTWSWASVDSSASLFTGPDWPNIMDTVVKPIDAALAFGNAERGIMTVRCKAARARLVRTADGIPYLSGFEDDQPGAFTMLQKWSSSWFTKASLPATVVYLDAPDDDLQGWDTCEIPTGEDSSVGKSQPFWDVWMLLLAPELDSVPSRWHMDLLVTPDETLPRHFRRIGVYDVKMTPGFRALFMPVEEEVIMIT